jgi:hypothetical protein
MFQPSRYRGVALVAIGIVIALGCLDAALTAAVGFTGRFLPNGESPTDGSVYTDTGARIARLLSEPRGTNAGAGAPLGILFGQSTLGSGVDARVLEENDDSELRWANLNGWGGSINRTRDIADLFFASGLKPDVVLLCINPYMLVGHEFEIEHKQALRKPGGSIRPWIWAYDNRFVVNHLSRELWHRAKLGLLRAFRFGFTALYRPSRDHDDSSRRKRLPSLSAKELAERVEGEAELGWFDPHRYDPEGSNARSLVEIVRESRKAGSKVGIILLPERSIHRDRIPPEAIRCFDEINRRNFPDDPVPVYNLRDRIPDDQFIDTDHPGLDAMPSISIMVGECVRDLLSDHPSPRTSRTRPAAGKGAEPERTNKP